MNYDSYYPLKINEQEEYIKKYFKSNSKEDLEWISQNRDFGEQERYKEKDEVDNSLINSKNVAEELELIKKFFVGEDILSSAKNYDIRLKQNLNDLTALYINGLDNNEYCNINAMRMLWNKIKEQSDIDNAHAMYLSSDNWSFSVFHKIIENISNLIDNDFEMLGCLLTAGMQDVRTSIFHDWTGYYKNMTREQYVYKICSDEKYVKSNGVIPLFTFLAETGERVNVSSPIEIFEAYLTAKNAAINNLKGNNQELLKRNIQAYELLFADRVTYDIYEYYGFYSFIRNALILKTKKLITKNINADVADQFSYYASTYQFCKISF